MRTQIRIVVGLFLALAASAASFSAQAADDPAAAEIRAAAARMVKAFEAGKATELAAMFSPQGELIDEEGTLYQGQKELAALFTKFFEKFPGARLAIQIDSIRTIGTNLAIEEGTRYIVAKDKETDRRAELRYTAVRTKVGSEWLIASCREFTADPLPTPRERLAPLAWVVGDWVNEESDGHVRIGYRWSEDGNFLLGDFEVAIAGKPAMKSSQRIGWDPLTGKVRSWLFDGDGGFSEGNWTLVEESWVIKSASVNPDGSTGSATLTLSPKDKDHFVLKGTERIVGDARETDFEIAVARRPPAAGK